MSRPYRTSGPYRDPRFDYLGNAANPARKISISPRSGIGAPSQERFKAVDVVLPGGRTVTRLVAV